jgi:hypothetical protein
MLEEMMTLDANAASDEERLKNRLTPEDPEGGIGGHLQGPHPGKGSGQPKTPLHAGMG